MDQTQLQEKIALYYQKLPEETKVLFAGMSWIEILQEINTKYSLNEEQIKTLGTETTILLLGIVSLEDYVQTIKNEIKIGEEKVNQLLDEVGEKILKDIAPLMYDSYNKNLVELMNEKFGQKFDERISALPTKIQDAIGDSYYQTSVYNIGNKYSLNINQIGDLEEITMKVMVGLLSPDKFDTEIQTKLNIDKNKSEQIVTDLNENIFKNIKEILKSNWDKSDIKVPTPPYKINKEEVPVPPYKINNQQSVINTKEEIKENDSHEEYKEHGIEILEDNKGLDTKIEAEVKPYTNILNDKLFNNTVSPKTVTDYSLPKVNKVLNPISTFTGSTSPKPHDPYHEEI